MLDTLDQIQIIETATFPTGGVTKATLSSLLQAFPEGLILEKAQDNIIGYLGWEKHIIKKFPPYNHDVLQSHEAPGRLAYISIITVKKEFRRQGVGSRLLTTLEQKARTHGCMEIYCPVNKHHPYLEQGVMQFWKKNGFSIAGETEWYLTNEKLIPSYIFSKKLV